MTTTSPSFFAREENHAIIRRFIMELESTPPPQSPIPNIIPALKQFFRTLLANKDAFDELCQTNIEWIGDQFISELSGITEKPPSERTPTLLSIFTSAYRFLCELEFSQPGDLSFELRGIKRFVEENLGAFPESDHQQLIYANYVMPAHITKRLINSPALIEFKGFAETARAATELKKNWDNELKEKNDEIENLRSGLERITTSYNFVGIVKGFENLGLSRRSEHRRSFVAVLVLGFFMVVPVAAELVFTYLNIDVIDTHRGTLVYTLPAIMALELILIYFFRVALLNFKTAKRELLQIDLRISLCQFIQSYSEYSNKIKKQDPAALEKFESLIFSSIASDNDPLPSTVDGLEQIAKIVSNARDK